MNRSIYISILILFVTTKSVGQISSYVKEVFAPEDSFIYTYINIELPTEIDLEKSKLDSFSKKKTEEFINYFLKENQTGLKQTLNRWKNYKQNYIHMDWVKGKTFENPYKYLSISLSGMKPSLIGELNRAGLYQLSFPIAAKYGIRMDKQLDLRRSEYNIESVTGKYITDLEKINNSEQAILLAFINTQTGVKRAKKRANSNKLSEYYNFLPEATKDFYFVNLAMESIIKNSKFGEKTKLQFTISNTRVIIDKELNLIALEKVTGFDTKKIYKHNPIILSNIIPKGSWVFPIVWNIENKLDSIYFYQDSILNNPDYRETKDTSKVELIETYYKVKKRENLVMVSQWYDIKINDIKIWNKLPNNDINSGQVLKLFVSKENEFDLSKINYLSLEEKNKLLNLTSFQEALKEFEFYIVVSGDALYLIAQKYKGVSADNIMRWNDISPNIQPGQKILIKSK